MRKNTKLPLKTKPKKRLSNDKLITLHVPVDAYSSLTKLADDNGMTMNSMFNFYIQQIINQEVDDSPALVDSSNSLVGSGKQEAVNPDHILIAKDSAIKYERFDISSTAFVRVYFLSFILAIIICIVVPLIAYRIQPLIASVFVPVFLSLIWGIVCIVISITARKASSRLLVSGTGWLVGTLSSVVVGIWLIALYNFVDQPSYVSPKTFFLVMMFGIVFVGLLVNVPIEINNLYIKRRAKQINENIVEWGEEVCRAVVNREIQPDMPKEMVLLAWGHPTLIENQEVIKDLFTERWVYKASSKSFYVWFTNGKVNKINDFGT